MNNLPNTERKCRNVDSFLALITQHYYKLNFLST